MLKKIIWQEYLIEKFLCVCAFISILTTFCIISVLVFETIGFFEDVSIVQFLGDTQWTPLFSNKHFGIWPLLSGTLLTTFIAISVALPLGILGAIYMSEFTTHKVRHILKSALEILAGIPTLVYGYFALIFMTPILQKIIPNLSSFNGLAPGIIMGIMIIPIISSLVEDSIHAVPQNLREASYALGITKFKTILHIVLPAAFSGITAASILALSRAIGETMIVAIAAGQEPRLTFDPRVPIETMTAYIVQISMGDVPTDTLEYKTIYAVGTTLFIITFSMNLLSQYLYKKFQQQNIIK